MIVIVMGVSGSGKTTISQALAQALGWHFSDADAFHTPAAKDKMKRGIPLNDQDRSPWLQALQSMIDLWLLTGQNAVLACSALKSKYRHVLRCDDPRVQLVYVQGSYELLFERLKHRQNHFMKENMLQSQFDTLEEPIPSEALYVDAAKPSRVIVQEILQRLKRTP